MEGPQVPAAHIPTDLRDDDCQVVGLVEASKNACQGVEIPRLTILQCISAFSIGAFRNQHLDVARKLVNFLPANLSGVSCRQHISDDSQELLLRNPLGPPPVEVLALVAQNLPTSVAPVVGAFL